MPRMRFAPGSVPRTGRIGLLVACILALPFAALAADSPALVRARMFYNAGNFDSAIIAASIARRQPQFADSAALVMARAHLEQYRQKAVAADLTSAREELASVHMDVLDAREQVDLLVALGQSLYLGEIFGAAAELFDTALGRGELLSDQDRLLLLDWWATALDREAQTRPSDRRTPIFERISDRMQEEVRRDPGSAPANYWLAVAARGRGDLERAWNAAIAGWVRSKLSPDSAAKLRADLDRLVTQALIPERARNRPDRDPEEAATMLRAEWDLVKEQWP